jgi:hypothetical protein
MKRAVIISGFAGLYKGFNVDRCRAISTCHSFYQPMDQIIYFSQQNNVYISHIRQAKVTSGFAGHHLVSGIGRH